MKTRCSNPNRDRYHCYGGRGIRVADEWQNDFEAFKAHVGPRPSDEHSLDRIDVNGDYAAGNVRWATQKEQSRNKRKNVNITAFGKTQTIAAWAEETGLDYYALYNRLRDGYLSPEEALTIPLY
jgi:hypothetical protein